MREKCNRNFDEALLSGYVDDELTQADRQRVRLHLEDCPSCRRWVEEVTEMQEAARSSKMPEPSDVEWDERPRSAGSRLSRRLGWGLVLVWLAGTLAFALWQWARDPGDLIPNLIAAGAIGGIALLFVSVLVDRLRAAKTDRYRRVQK